MPHHPAIAKETRVRLCFLSHRQLSQLTRSILIEYADRADIEIIEASFASAVERAQARERSGEIDAFVSAGANAMILRSQLKSPVAAIKASGYDVLLALKKAGHAFPRVGVVTYFETIPELDAIRDLLKIDIAQYAYSTPEEMRECVTRLATADYRVVVGSSLVVEMAQALGLEGILAYTLPSVRQGIEDAIHLAHLSRRDAARYEQLNGVLRNLQEAVLSVDAANCVVAVNAPMEALLGRSRQELIGAPLEKLEPALSLRGILESGQEERGQVLHFAHREWVMNRTPILERSNTVGAVLTLHDAHAIHDADSSLRSRRKNHRHHGARYTLRNLEGESASFVRARDAAMRFAKTDLTALISGESGTGKELFAQAIHNASARADKPFVAANCAAFPESLLESELFGYEEGAFTGSRKGGKRGLFESAHTGTLFLDEIGDMPLSLQTRLLRVLQEREIVRLGGAIPIPVDVRIVAATHQPLDEMVRERRFRSDLYYRINILQLTLPPLRERDEDILALAHSLMRRCLLRLDCPLDAQALLAPIATRLRAYDWPGNVRELENLCERMAVFFAQYPTLAAVSYRLLEMDCPELFGPRAPAPAPAHPARRVQQGALPLPAPTAPMSRDDLRSYTHPGQDAGAIVQALRACGGNRTLAARQLGISRATLWRRMRDLFPQGRSEDSAELFHPIST